MTSFPDSSNASPSVWDVVVVGAGLCGLTAAWRLHQQGLKVCVLEAAGRVGGCIGTVRSQEGYLIETGPHTFPGSAKELIRLCEALKISPQAASSSNKKRYIRHKGMLHAVPINPMSLLASPLLSAKGKLRLLLEPFQPKTPSLPEPTVADFIQRRLGHEVLQRMVGPFLSGVYAGNPEALSAAAVFKKLFEWEQTHGSLTAGFVQRLLSRQQQQPTQTAGQAFPPATPSGKATQLFGFVQGLGQLTEALHQALPQGTVHCNTPVVQITRSAAKEQQAPTEKPTEQFNAPPGFCLSIASATSSNAPAEILPPLHARQVILALPAFAAAALLQELSPNASQALQSIPYVPVSVVHLGFLATALQHPLDGFGCLLPREENIPLLGSIWASSLFPNRAPEGQVLLSNFMGGAFHPELALTDDAKLVEQTCQDLQAVFQLPKAPQPDFECITRYQQAIPQYNLGHLHRVARIENALSADCPGLYLAGNYLHGIALNACVVQAQYAAEQAIKQKTSTY
ncbi:MAG: protoporphyrinogen oxidase [Candidatus Melainabacteria bacterium]|nr:protoporphyrinogen oxidase [Candidatus Melainabacteria bacterium]